MQKSAQEYGGKELGGDRKGIERGPAVEAHGKKGETQNRKREALAREIAKQSLNVRRTTESRRMMDGL